VEYLKSRRFSERRACRLAGFSRSAALRPLKGRKDAKLRTRLKRQTEQYPKYGCQMPHDMLLNEGEVVNKRRTYRICCEEGLHVRTKKCKKLLRPRVPMLVPDTVKQRWSTDYVSDQPANGRRFGVLNVVDDFSREYVLKIIDLSISGHRVAREFDRIARRLPQTGVCDYGSELTSKAMYF
jgi:putative transposase